MSSIEAALKELRENPIYKAVLAAANPEQQKLISERAEALVSILGGALSKTSEKISSDPEAAKSVHNDLSVFNNEEKI